MLIVHGVGIFILLVGVALFIRSQFKAPADTTTSEIKAVKVTIAGPPSMALVVFGAAVFLFPFTPWFSSPEPQEEIPVTVPEQTTTTTTTAATQTTALSTTTEYVLPLAPYDYIVEYDADTCGGYAIEWFTEGDPAGWYVAYEVYNATTGDFIDAFELNTGEESRWYPGRPRLCEWEFFYDFPVSYDEGTYYHLFVYSYDEENFSEDALFVEYP